MPPDQPRSPLGRSPREVIAESAVPYRDHGLEIRPKQPEPAPQKPSTPPVKRLADHASSWKTVFGIAAALVVGGAGGGALAAGPGAKVYVDKTIKDAVAPVASANIAATNDVLTQLRSYNDRLVTLEAIMPIVREQNTRIEGKIDKLNEKFLGPDPVRPMGPRGAR